ncbi:MAG: MFS transporter [Firmicutes bacterium]|nr:MFS transporter [Bacillota bacterium]
MARSTPLRRRLLLFYGYRGLVYFYLWLPVGAAYFTDYRGLSLAQYALIGTVGWLAMALAEVPTGAMADALGRRRSLALGAFLHGLGMLGQGLTGDFAWLVAFGVLRTLGFSFISGTDHAWLYDSLKADGEESRYTREAGRAAAVMHAAQGAASIAGAPLAVYHLAAPLVATAAVSFVAALLALRLPELPRVVPAAEGPA